MDNGSTVAHTRTRVAVARTGTSMSEQAETAISYMKRGTTLVPAILIGVCPAFVMVFCHLIVELNGDLSALVEEMRAKRLYGVVYDSWIPYLFGSAKAWRIILPFAALELLLMKILPGKLTKGPVTPAGNVPVYKANGVLAFVVSIAVYFACAKVFNVFNPADVYDHYLELIGAMNLFSLLFCIGLYLKGRFFPSSTDCGLSGNMLFDYYWGTELYPRVFGWDIKMFTNCRFGLMGWALLVISYAMKQHDAYGLSDSMIVAVGLQLVYIAKFFHWEMGYMKSLDIMHDRAGWMLCWGCLVWVPSVYTSSTLYLTAHPIQLGLPLAVAIFTIGTIGIFLNYAADAQREMVRNTNGNCVVWGSKPEVIHATYYTKDGEKKKSLLLVSGWWGVSRHFHYIPELLAALFWSLPALSTSIVPYFYFIFLCILLTNRAIRDDRRCAEKYGKYWKIYCEKVPYKILPFIY